MKHLRSLTVASLLASAVCGAQPPADSRPARTNVLGAEYPRVTGDGRAVFRFKVLGAQKVQADITGATFDMAKDPNGDGLPARSSFSDGNPVVMYLGPMARTGPVPSADSLTVLDQYFAWRRTLAGAR